MGINSELESIVKYFSKNTIEVARTRRKKKER
jgi:hypothetical protein